MHGDGRALAVVASFCFALAATLQQRGQYQLASKGRPVRNIRDIFRLAKVWVWLAGTAVLLAGYAIQGAALDIGKVVIVQPLLVTSVVFALPLGYWLTSQHVSRQQVAGAVVVVAGLAMFIRLGDPNEGVDSAPAWQLLIAITAIGMISVGLLLVGRRLRPTHKAAVFGVVAGLLFGLSATFTKPVLQSFDLGSGETIASWEAYALVGFGVIAFGIQQLSLATGQLAPALAAVAVANPFTSTLIGMSIYDERLSPPGWHTALAVMALLVGLTGAVIVTLASHENEMPTAGPGA